MNKTMWWIVAVIVVVALGAFSYWSQTAPAPSPTPSQESNAEQSATSSPDANATSVTYLCDKGHTIKAVFRQGPTPSPAKPGEPPIPTGSVEVSLDGKQPVTLARTLSADGTRYSDGDPQIPQGKQGAESLVFWSKGDDALLMRNNAMDLAYSNCTAHVNK
jgi:membrane-bound inhibitor of C-type lysozyme